jgi:hypothetical protein
MFPTREFPSRNRLGSHLAVGQTESASRRTAACECQMCVVPKFMAQNRPLLYH